MDQRNLFRHNSPLQIGLWAIFVAAVCYGLYEVVQWQWVCDDAFISFRYARNLVNGLGLVFNAGERVEGYSNFLWTIILAAGMWLKADPVWLSVWLGGLAFFVTVGAFAWLSYRFFASAQHRTGLFFPMTSIALLLHHDCHVYATSGLETSFDTMLISIGFILLVRATNTRSYFWVGLVLILAAATRPDSLIFYVIGGAFVMAVSEVRWRALWNYAIPLAVLYLPYWLIRYHYYGWPFPNTYYAKSADLPYYSQGLVYLWLYLKSYYVLALVPVATVVAFYFRRKELLRFPQTDPIIRALSLSALFCIPYIAYVVRVGGDFMFARFFIPVTPILFFALESSLRTVFARTRALVPVALALLLLVLLRSNPFAQAQTVDYVADEPSYYPKSIVSQARDIGTKMKHWFEGTDARVSFRGMFAMYAYFSEVPVAIEEQTGLTDQYIAHLPIAERGRPGHEKHAPPSYLYERKINFLLRGGLRATNFADSLMVIYFDTMPAFVLNFNNQLMDHLKQYPDIQFTDIRSVIDSMIARLEDRRDTAILQSYPSFLKDYYFKNNEDSAREKWFLSTPDR